MASVLRAARLSCARGLPLQQRQRASTPCHAAAAVDLVRGTSSAKEMSAASFDLIQPKGLIRSPQQLFRLPTPGCITPNMNLIRRFSFDHKIDEPNLPVLTQAEFFELEDMKIAEWKDPVSFLEKHPAVIDAQKHNKLIAAGGTRPWMLSGIGRILWQTAVQLVFINRLRRHDIARGLVEDNVLVSPYGTFALKNPISDPCDKTKPFMGYKALRTLFLTLMKKVYGVVVISSLTLDVQHFLDTLQNPLDDRLCLYHAVFLSPTGRALLSIRLHSLVRCEVNLEGFQWSENEIFGLLQNLPHVSSDHTNEETDRMHIFFRCLRQHGQRRKAKNQIPTGQKQTEKGPLKELDEEAEQKALIRSGYALVGLNRNGVLHRIVPKDMEKLAQTEKDEGKFTTEPSPVKRWYCLWEIVQLLHYHMPQLLPVAQYEAMKNNLWRHLEMGALWPRDEIFHYMTPKRIGPTPSMSSMFTYHSNRAIDSDKDPNNSKIFIGGLGPTVKEEDLERAFGPYGELVDVRILNGKNCGFVEFSTRASAEEAIRMLNGIELGCCFIRLSFARRPAMKKGPLLGGHYAHPQTYDTYAWAMEAMESDKKDRPQIPFVDQVKKDGKHTDLDR